MNIGKKVTQLAVSAAMISLGLGAHAFAADPAIKPVPPTAVHLTDSFWKPKLDTLCKVTIPAEMQRDVDGGRVDDFDRAAAVLAGKTDVDKKTPTNLFDDAQVYRGIEAASYSLAIEPDAQLAAKLDDLIAKIGAAQEKDGYLYTARTIDPTNPPTAAGAERWASEKADSYELFDLGALYEAAYAHHLVTGKKTLLDIAVKSADLLDATFGPGKKAIFPGHTGIEIGLVHLYQATGEKKYLDLAKFFIDQRGPDANAAAPGAGARRGRGGANPAMTNQSQTKAVNLTTASGNAVNGEYLYAGMEDIAALTGDAAYSAAVDKVWDNIVGGKLYVTGGITGGGGDGAFMGTTTYQFNTNASSPTSAAAASEYLDQRLFLAHGDGKYIDVLERTLYNGLLAGMSLDGKRFFETNSIESLARPQQRRDAGAVANGPNGAAAAAANAVNAANGAISMTKMLAALPAYFFAQQGDKVYVNLYAACTADIKLDSGAAVKITEETKYPWDGAVKLTIGGDLGAKFQLNLRLPGWARNEAIPSKLYAFADNSLESAALKVNGKDYPLPFLANGYLPLQCNVGDVVELSLPMPVRRLQMNNAILDGHGRVALQRGPIVYCAEGVDGPNGKIRNLALPDDVKLTPEYSANLLGGVEVLKGKAQFLHIDEHDVLQKPEGDFTAIPYFAWANRTPGELLVWIPNSEVGAGPTAAPDLSAKATVTASAHLTGTNARVNAQAAKDGIEPRSSHDNGPLAHFDWWPDNNTTADGKPEWVEYTFAEPTAIHQTEVYWWDDSNSGGGCKAPASWKAFYKDGNDWKPVKTTDAFGVETDKYNKVNFEPVTTTGLRLEIVLPDQESIGIQEWKVW